MTARVATQLLVLANRQAAEDLAIDAGTRRSPPPPWSSTTPLVLDVESRRIGDGSRIVLLHVGDQTCVDDPQVEIKHQKGSFRFAGLSIGPLAATDDQNPHRFSWAPSIVPSLEQGDRLVVGDFDGSPRIRATPSSTSPDPAPTTKPRRSPTCDPHSYDDDPDAHQYCCKPHEIAEADFSDELARRRPRGELNPQVWPPVVDGDAFEVVAAGSAVRRPLAVPATPVPDDVTMDDLE